MHRWVLRMSAATGHSFVSSGLPPTDRKFKGHYRASSTLGQGSSRLITLPHRPRPYARRPTPQAASSNSSCRSIRAGAMGGTLDGSPTPSRYPRTDAPAVSAAMMETVGLCYTPAAGRAHRHIHLDCYRLCQGPHDGRGGSRHHRGECGTPEGPHHACRAGVAPAHSRTSTARSSPCTGVRWPIGTDARKGPNGLS